LTKEPERFDLFTIDAFNSDAIPTHLLTREAFALYRDRLDRSGVVAFHVSNRFLDLAPVAAGLAHDGGWMAVQTVPQVPLDTEIDDEAVWSTMVAAAADSSSLLPLVATGRWEWSPRGALSVWTDNWTPLARSLSFSRASLLGR
jgi:spermidine synthase